MKKQNIFVRIWNAITYPFEALAVLIDEERRSNLDGKYDKYWEHKNRRELRKRKRG